MLKGKVILKSWHPFKHEAARTELGDINGREVNIKNLDQTV